MSSEMIEIIAPAFIVGLMIAIVHAPLGVGVLSRGIIFIDLAIAQIAGLGVVIANIYMHEPEWYWVQGIALICALIAAFLFQLIEKKMPELQEAIIGCSFVIAASLALLLLADHPHGGEEIQHLLSGQILFVTWKDVMIFAPVYLVIFALWFIFPGKVRSGLCFYLLFAIAITSSVQLVGVYVVFASLILPAIVAIKSKKAYQVAWLCGVLSICSGVLASVWMDAPAGPTLVFAYAIISMLAGVLKLIRY